MDNPLTIRRAIDADAEAIDGLYRATIFAVNQKDYNGEQLKAWAGQADKKEKWREKISAQYFLVVFLHEMFAGFGSITTKGYLDFLFVHHALQGQGIAQALYTELEKYAEFLSLHSIEVHASRTARPFFEKRGFTTLGEQTVEVNGVQLNHFNMKKQLPRTGRTIG